jgi:spore coat protein U-like protein
MSEAFSVPGRALLILPLLAGLGVAATCSVSTGGAGFGSSTAFTIPTIDVVISVSVTCSGTAAESVPFTLAASSGAGSYATRHMAGSSGWTVPYNLYIDPSRSQVWGDGSGGSYTVSGSFTLAGSTPENHSITFYGRIPSGGNQWVGTVSDTVALTLTYQSGPQAFTTLAVNYAVNASCTISAATLSFGEYDPIAANRTTPAVASTSVGYQCIYNPVGPNATFTLGQGLHPASGSSDNEPLRRMTDGTHFLSYNLYDHSACGNVWNNTTGFTQPGSGDAEFLTIYGCIDAGQTAVPAGFYTDTVVMTVTF